MLRGWIGLPAAVIFSMLNGGALNAGADLKPAEHEARVTNCLLPPVLVQGEPRQCKTVAARMAELKIPGVSVAVVHNGEIAWAKGFGVQGPDGKLVTETTLFQAGSISKPVAAMAALRLVQEGKLSLDTDINQALVSWHLPADPKAPEKAVTLRELLTHTGGISVHGFPGYAAGEPIPSLVSGARWAETCEHGPNPHRKSSWEPMELLGWRLHDRAAGDD